MVFVPIVRCGLIRRRAGVLDDSAGFGSGGRGLSGVAIDAGADPGADRALSGGRFEDGKRLCEPEVELGRTADGPADGTAALRPPGGRPQGAGDDVDYAGTALFA